jgi:hypothetical protein
VTTSPDPGAAGHHHVERLVEHHLGATRQRVDREVGVHGHAHLAAAREHVDGAVVVVAEQRAVRARRLGELVDLFAQRRDVLARFTQRVRQLLVLARRLRELTLGLEQALFERAHPLGSVVQLATQPDDFVFEHLDVLLQLGNLALVGTQPSFVLRGLPVRRAVRCRHGSSYLPWTHPNSAPAEANCTATTMQATP